MKRLLSFAAILILSTGISAAVTVTGSLGLITGNPAPSQRITFTALLPIIDGSSTILPRSAQTTSDASGNFTINLIPGQYTMAVEGLRILTFPVAADATLVNLNSPINAYVTILLGTNSLYKAKVSTNDTAPGHLSDKIVGPSVTTTNIDGVEKIYVAASGSVSEEDLDLANIGGTLPPAKLQGGINATNIGAGSVSSTEFGYIDGLTSSAQGQLDGKAASSHSHAASAITSGTIDNDRLTAISSVNAGIVPAPTAAFQLLQSDGSSNPVWSTNYPPIVTPSLTVESNVIFSAATATTMAGFDSEKQLVSMYPTNAANWTASGGTNSGLSGNANVGGTVAATFVTASDSITSYYYWVRAGYEINWIGGTRIAAPVDGQLYIRNAANTDFSRLMLGGTTASYPAIKRNGTGIDIRLADDSGYGPLMSAQSTAQKGFQQYQGTLTHAGTTTLDFDAATTDNYMSITGGVTLATSNLATNRNYSLTLYWTGITNAPLTTPAWLWQGYAPTNLWPTNKTFTILLKARGSNDTNITAVFGGQY